MEPDLDYVFAFVTAGCLGKVYPSPTDVKLAANGGVQPDLVFVRRDRLAIVGSHFIDGAPDLLVEVFSPSTRSYDRDAKFGFYARAGVPEFWFVDPVAETLTDFALRDGTYVPLPNDGARSRSLVLAGLAIDVPALFVDLT